MTTLRRVGVFCGASEQIAPAYRAVATSFGTLLAEQGIGVVFGGGRVGMMGAVADAALAAGGEVIGVIPQVLESVEITHTGATQIMIVDGMHSRKQIMASLSDGFVALPGGFGTLDEIFEAITWNQVGIHDKPTGFLNVEGYFDHLLDFFDHAVGQQFISAGNRARVISSADGPDLLRLLSTHV